MAHTEPAMPPIRALIVDDEEPGRINLRYAFAAHGRWQVVAECASAAEARSVLAREAVDVVLLDIRMPKESGLALARSLCTQAEPPLIIFVTAYDAHALEAFDVHAIDYLLKPFDSRRLAQALERAAQMLALQQRAPYAQVLRAYLDAHAPATAGEGDNIWQDLTVRSVGRIERVDLDEVSWIGAAGNYVELHTPGRTHLHRLPLSKLEPHLNPAHFVRAHRGVIVRTDQCMALRVVGDGSYVLTLRCGDEVAVSERHVHAIRAHLRAR